jgi:hypothetical protein
MSFSHELKDAIGQVMKSRLDSSYRKQDAFMLGAHALGIGGSALLYNNGQKTDTTWQKVVGGLGVANSSLGALGYGSLLARSFIKPAASTVSENLGRTASKAASSRASTSTVSHVGSEILFGESALSPEIANNLKRVNSVPTPSSHHTEVPQAAWDSFSY